MSYALGLGPDRPRPAGILALSGFIPVDFARQARATLETAGADVLYREYPLPHTIDPAFLQDGLVPWLRETLPAQ